jgi:nucleoside-diphosphate-sugar epimerase
VTKQILITGGAGFVGYHLARKLSEDPENRVVLIDNFQRGEDDAALGELGRRPNVEIEQYDLTDQRNNGAYLMNAHEYDEVYHLAAVNGTAAFYERPADVLRTNLLALLAVLDYCRPIGGRRPRLLFTSSNEAYAGMIGLATDLGFSAPIPTSEGTPLVVADPYNPRWSYGGSKIVGEQLVIAYARQHGLPAVIVRPHNFYGPRAGSGHVIPQTIDKIRRRVDPFPIPGSDQTRSFCYIDDAVDAMIRAMALASTACPTFHIGDSFELSMYTLVRRLFEVVGEVEAQRGVADAGWRPSSIEHTAAPVGSVRRRCPDVSRIRLATGWQATTLLDVGLRRTAEWYLSR